MNVSFVFLLIKTHTHKKKREREKKKEKFGASVYVCVFLLSPSRPAAMHRTMRHRVWNLEKKKRKKKLCQQGFVSREEGQEWRHLW